MPTWIERPSPNPIARRLSFQSILFAVGEGVFLTGSAVFFTQIVGLSASQVGLGLTSPGWRRSSSRCRSGRLPTGSGPSGCGRSASFVAAALYAVWPFVERVRAVPRDDGGAQIVETAGHSARGAYTLDVFPREDGSRSHAYMRAPSTSASPWAR